MHYGKQNMTAESSDCWEPDVTWPQEWGQTISVHKLLNIKVQQDWKTFLAKLENNASYSGTDSLNV